MVSKALLIGGAVALVVVVIIVVVPSVLLTRKDTATFRDGFIERCLKYPEEEAVCEYAWTLFERAYVGKDKCNISAESYAPLFDLMPYEHRCGKTMFYCKTYDLVHNFTKKRDCLFTLEDTLLGSMLDKRSWCGKVGSTETFTENCENCTSNPVHSFWAIASTRLALHACEEATVMLDGERAEPYDPNSYFGYYEVPNLQVSHVRTLTVLLITQEDGRNCSCDSLGTLRQDLDFRIGCSCIAVTESHIQTCIANNTPCGTCW